MKIGLKIQWLLLAVIFFEGFIVLAAELLAIRLMLPFVGSGTEIVSIIISAVLMPLAIGYHMGGEAYTRQRAKARRKGRKVPSNREILSRNALSALIVLCFGMSYSVLEVFFGVLSALGLSHRLIATTLYSLLFLVTPVYLLAQTIPLISRYFRHLRLHHITGKNAVFLDHRLFPWLDCHHAHHHAISRRALRRHADLPGAECLGAAATAPPL